MHAHVYMYQHVHVHALAESGPGSFPPDSTRDQKWPRSASVNTKAQMLRAAVQPALRRPRRLQASLCVADAADAPQLAHRLLSQAYASRPRRQLPPSVNVTTSAAQKISRLLKTEAASGAAGVRMGMSNDWGSPTGFSYTLGFVRTDDVQVVQGPMNLAVSRTSHLLLRAHALLASSLATGDHHGERSLAMGVSHTRRRRVAEGR